MTENITFANAAGDALSARLETPDEGEIRAYAVFAHCFTCGKAIGAAVQIARSLAREGIATLRFDFTGLSESEGDFAHSGFQSNVSDLIAAAEFMEQEYESPRFLLGHSLGGTAAIQAASAIDSVRAVCSIGSPFEPDHALHLVGDALDTVQAEGRAKVELAGRTFEISRDFVDQFESAQMESIVKNLGRAILVMHSPVDNTVGIDHAAKIFGAAKHPRSYISLDDADHMLSRKRDAQYAGRMAAAWATRYLD